MSLISRDTIRNHFPRIEGTTMADYPAEVTNARMYMASGLTDAMKGEEKWPHWADAVCFANDFVLVTTAWCNPRNNVREYPYVAMPSEVYHEYWNHGDNPNYMRDGAEAMLRFINSR